MSEIILYALQFLAAVCAMAPVIMTADLVETWRTKEIIEGKEMPSNRITEITSVILSVFLFGGASYWLAKTSIAYLSVAAPEIPVQVTRWVVYALPALMFFIAVIISATHKRVRNSKA